MNFGFTLAVLPVVAVLVFVALSPPRTEPAPQTFEPRQIERLARRELSHALVDPESAQFRELSTSLQGRIVCGEVNARNMVGGYTGFRRFVIGIETIQFEPDARQYSPEVQRIFEEHWQALCRGEGQAPPAPAQSNVVLLGG